VSRSRKKPYPRKNDSRHFDWSCKNHGGCPYCESNRQHADRKRRTAANEDLNAYDEIEDQ